MKKPELRSLKLSSVLSSQTCYIYLQQAKVGILGAVSVGNIFYGV